MFFLCEKVHVRLYFYAFYRMMDRRELFGRKTKRRTGKQKNINLRSNNIAHLFDDKRF
jgi:hypothetical protein